jgi:hypothetical protein
MHPITELNKVAREFHHVQGERAREGVSGSWRRRQRARLEELEEKFDTLLVRWVPDATEQMRWREHLYRGAEAPSDLIPDEPPLFRGRSAQGSSLVIRADHEEQELILDGALVARWPLRRTIDAPVHHGGMDFFEVFEANPDALEALLDYVARRVDAPPWEWARELYEDGLIDSNFGLTARGRRFRAGRRG